MTLIGFYANDLEEDNVSAYPRDLAEISRTTGTQTDPDGEHHAIYLVSKAWKLYGNKLFPEAEPEPGRASISDKIGYHLRKGSHNLCPLKLPSLF